MPSIFNLQGLATRYRLDIDTFRRVAYELCDVPKETPQSLVDLWLYEQLATSINFFGMRIEEGGSNLDESIRAQIQLSVGLFRGKSDFKTHCAESLADVVANPIVRHEILLRDEPQVQARIVPYWRKSAQ